MNRLAQKIITLMATLCLFCVLGYSFFVALPTAARTDIHILDLNNQIVDRKNKISTIKKQIDIYEKNIQQRRAKASSLQNEAEIINDDISKTALDIDATSTEVDQLNLEIQQADLSIQQAEAEIALQKQRLGAFLRQLYYNSERSYLDVLLSNNSFSDFFDSVYYLEKAHTDVKQALVRIKVLREQTLAQKTNLDEQRKRQQDLQSSLVSQKDNLEEKKSAKEELASQSTLTAEKFEKLLQQARGEQASISADIQNLEQSVREKLQLQSTGPFAFAWPVSPGRGISAYFHDPSYPFRYVFEHSAIDIRAYQSTSVTAAEDGYVGRAKNGGKGYSYIMVVHDKGFATVYGHISRIMVAQDSYVKKGQIIGLSGGKPGSDGAGAFTTGPHLHFEVRLNGVPVDPLKYLP